MDRDDRLIQVKRGGRLREWFTHNASWTGSAPGGVEVWCSGEMFSWGLSGESLATYGWEARFGIMSEVVQDPEALRKTFAALTEHTFQVRLGIADPPLTDYLTDLLLRFVRLDALFHLRDALGRRLEEVAEMLIEADARTGRAQREIYRHIGDFTLFWAGVYPESLRRLQGRDHRDHLLDYLEQGKRGYLIASTFTDDPYTDESCVLRRLSYEFELCTIGLQQVRKEWERAAEGHAA